MKTKYRILFSSLALMAGLLNSFAQYPEDALRYSTPGLGVGARALGMGMAYTGVANDFSATYWNPAGLGQMRLSEVNFGLSNVSFSNNGTFYGSSESMSNSGTALNDFGLVYPFPTQRGSLVLAVGYGRSSDYTTGLSFSGYNPNSSIVQTWAPNGQTLSSDVTIAEYLNLAYADTITSKFVSPIAGNLTQRGTVLEGGGQNYLTVAAAVEASKNLYLGATLNFITGSYSYTRSYEEDDLANHYTSNTRAVYNNGTDTAMFDLNYLTLDQTNESDLSGFTMKLGLLYKFGPGSRIGFTIKTPSWINVHETFSTQASSKFDNGDYYTYPSGGSYPQKDEYDVTTPYVFSAGLSHTIGELMLAGDLEYTDWTQMQFSNASVDVTTLNITIKQEFRQTLNLRGGAEYEFPASGVRLRGGFAYIPSPYVGDPSSFAQKYITGGLGFIIQDSFSIDFGFAHGYWKSYIVNYDATSRVDENITSNNLIGTVSYRF